MKRILASLVMIVLASSVGVGATRAYFTDSNTLQGVAIESGNADLKLTQIIMHQWFDGTVSYTGDWKTYASGLWSGKQWYPGLSVDDGFYLGNYSSAQVGLTPTLSLQNYSGLPGMDNAFELRVVGTGYDSGFLPLSWWRSNSFTLPNIAWEQTGAYGTHGTYAGTMTLRMRSDADNTMSGGSLNFDLHFDAEQTH